MVPVLHSFVVFLDSHSHSTTSVWICLVLRLKVCWTQHLYQLFFELQLRHRHDWRVANGPVSPWAGLLEEGQRLCLVGHSERGFKTVQGFLLNTFSYVLCIILCLLSFTSIMLYLYNIVQLNDPLRVISTLRKLWHMYIVWHMFKIVPTFISSIVACILTCLRSSWKGRGPERGACEARREGQGGRGGRQLTENLETCGKWRKKQIETTHKDE